MSMPFDVFILSCAPLLTVSPWNRPSQKGKSSPNHHFSRGKLAVSFRECNNSEGFSDRSIRFGLLNTLADVCEQKTSRPLLPKIIPQTFRSVTLYRSGKHWCIRTLIRWYMMKISRVLSNVRTSLTLLTLSDTHHFITLDHTPLLLVSFASFASQKKDPATDHINRPSVFGAENVKALNLQDGADKAAQLWEI